MLNRAPHLLARTLTLGLLSTAAIGCGGKKPAGPAGGTAPAGSPAAPPADPPAEKKDLPQAPESAMRPGKTRLVNLLADAPGAGTAGKTNTVDIWAVRSFQYGPTRLVEGLKFGSASPWFTAAKGMSVVAVPAGAPGESDKSLTSVHVPDTAEKETSILYRDKDGHVVSATPGGMPTAASVPSDKALIVLDASQLMGFETQLQASPLGGKAFEVGDGAGNCVTNTVLGGTNHTQHEVPAGAVRFTLHKWPGDCKSEPVGEVKLDAAAGKGQIVYLYTTDGKSLAQLAVPIE